ncbi:MAG: VOC family protein [Acidobacteria bacterium]|nr:VOC family protein [Acidobacteriota bacterium]
MLAQCDLMGFIPITDARRARAFYIDKLKLQFVSDDQFALVVRANGNDIRLTHMKAVAPAPYTICGWKVSDIEAAAKELISAGVVFEKYPFVEDPSGIWTAPGGARIAWFKDPDGNVLSISNHPKH